MPIAKGDLMLNAPSDAKGVVEIELAFPGGSGATTVKAANQLPALVDAASSASGSVVVTAYYLFDDKREGLRLLQWCFEAL